MKSGSKGDQPAVTYRRAETDVNTVLQVPVMARQLRRPETSSPTGEISIVQACARSGYRRALTGAFLTGGEARQTPVDG